MVKVAAWAWPSVKASARVKKCLFMLVSCWGSAHAAQGVVFEDQVVPERGGHVACQREHEQPVQRFVQLGELLAQGFVFADQVGNRQHAKPHGLDAFGRAHEPATQRDGDHQSVEAEVSGVGQPLHGRRQGVRQGLRPVGDAPQPPHPDQQEHADASPFVPGIQLQFLWRERQLVHVNPQHDQTDDEHSHEPVQCFGYGGVGGVVHVLIFGVWSVEVVAVHGDDVVVDAAVEGVCLGLRLGGAQSGEQRQQVFVARVGAAGAGLGLAVVEQGVGVGLAEMCVNPVGKLGDVGGGGLAGHADDLPVAQVVGDVA